MCLFKVERNIIFAALANVKSLLFKSTTTWPEFMNLTAIYCSISPGSAPLVVIHWRFQRRWITNMSPISWPEWRFPPSGYGDFLTPDSYGKRHRNICIYLLFRIYEFYCHIAGDHQVPSTLIINCELPSILRSKPPVLCNFYKTGGFCYSFTSLSKSMPSTTYCKISS